VYRLTNRSGVYRDIVPCGVEAAEAPHHAAHQAICKPVGEGVGASHGSSRAYRVQPIHGNGAQARVVWGLEAGCVIDFIDMEEHRLCYVGSSLDPVVAMGLHAADRDKFAEHWDSDPTYKKAPKNLAEGRTLKLRGDLGRSAQSGRMMH
jgi:hypothetical protein